MKKVLFKKLEDKKKHFVNLQDQDKKEVVAGIYVSTSITALPRIVTCTSNNPISRSCDIVPTV
ncbi:MAG: hypothetical protein GY765_41590 [bacterium]|nr:hypothetical protein [bacterium]